MFDAIIGSIYPFSFGFVPKGFVLCNGASLPVRGNEVLYGLLKNTYGGDGNRFNLPNLLDGRTAIGYGQQPGGAKYDLGQAGGNTQVTLNNNQIPIHTHPITVALKVNKDATTSADPIGRYPAKKTAGKYFSGIPTTGETLAPKPVIVITPFSGSNQPFDIKVPTLVMNYCMCVEGVYPVFPPETI